MKKSLLTLLILSMPLFLMAQDAPRQKEAGLVFSNLDNFGLTYRTGTDKSLWRFNTLLMSRYQISHSADSLFEDRDNFGFSVQFGREFRKELVKNLELRYGLDLFFGYSHSIYEYDEKTTRNNDRVNERTTYQPGIKLVFGLNYVINDTFVVGAELLPYFTYTTGTLKDKGYYNIDNSEVVSDISGVSYGISNSSAMISLTCRF